jgi:hypothetical protein
MVVRLAGASGTPRVQCAIQRGQPGHDEHQLDPEEEPGSAPPARRGPRSLDGPPGDGRPLDQIRTSDSSSRHTALKQSRNSRLARASAGVRPFANVQS